MLIQWAYRVNIPSAAALQTPEQDIVLSLPKEDPSPEYTVLMSRLPAKSHMLCYSEHSACSIQIFGHLSFKLAFYSDTYRISVTV